MRRRGRVYLAVALCVVLGTALGVWHGRTATRRRPDPVTSIVRTVTAPFLMVASGCGRWASRQFGWLVHGRSVDGDLRRLREENGRLSAENARLKEAEADAIRLRAQLGFASAPPANKIAANVISLRPDPKYDTIIIDRGSTSGVHVRSVVVCPLGLVGQVYDVAPTTSAVLLLTDPNSSVGARVQRAESRAVGVAKGTGAALLSLAYLDLDSDVKPGDAIVSSGLGGARSVYPKGLMIGHVVSVANEASGSSRDVRVRPSVDFTRLEEVYVLP